MAEKRQEGRQPKTRRTTAALVAFATLLTAALVVTGHLPTSGDSATSRPAVDVPLRAPPSAAGNHSLVVTLRWGDTQPDGVAAASDGVQRWDGQIALTCGVIEDVLPVGFDPSRGDTVAPLLPNQPLAWRSALPHGRWAGLRIHVRTCANDTEGADAQTTQAAQSPWLRIDTPFAHHELELRAGRNSFEAIPAESAESRSDASARGDLLEVHVAPRVDTLHVSEAPVT